MKVFRIMSYIPGEVELVVDPEIARAVAAMVFAKATDEISGAILDADDVFKTDAEKVKDGRDLINTYLKIIDAVTEAEEKAEEREAGDK